MNLHRTPAAVPYRAGFFAGGVQSNAATPFSNAVPANFPNIANFTLPHQPLVPSPSHQLYSSEPTTQAGRYPHMNDGSDVDTADGQLYYHSNVTDYDTAPRHESSPVRLGPRQSTAQGSSLHQNLLVFSLSSILPIFQYCSCSPSLLLLLVQTLDVRSPTYYSCRTGFQLISYSPPRCSH